MSSHIYSYMAKRIATAERRVINAAMRLAKKGDGFVYRDDGKVSDASAAVALERACAALSKARTTATHSPTKEAP